MAPYGPLSADRRCQPSSGARDPVTSLHSSVSIGPSGDQPSQQGFHVITPSFVALASSPQGPGIDRSGAHLAVDTLARRTPTATTAGLVQAFRVANQAVRRSTAGAGHDRAAAGPALVALELHRDATPRCVAVASVGDSSVYRRRELTTWRVTGRGVAGGSAALGVSRCVDIQVWELGVHDGDQFLVCSEAVAAAVDEDTVAEICAREADIDTAAGSVVAAAVAAGAVVDAVVVAVTVR